MKNLDTPFIKSVKNKFKFNFFLFLKLPAVYFSGIKVVEFSDQQAGVSVKYKWFNQNPFRSIYFASLAMAAELSTGLLAFNAISEIKPSVAMLVQKMNADFKKKATGKIIFTCIEGRKIKNAVAQAIKSGKGKTVEVKTVGLNEELEEVAEFRFTWTFKQRHK